jgi:hypothetical protein
MVCFNPPHIESVWITDAVSKLRTVDPTSSAVQAARALGISFGDGRCSRSPFEAVATELEASPHEAEAVEHAAAVG